MSDNKRSGGLFAGKGYYIALILCAAAIGITGYVYSQSNDKTQEAVIQETYVDIPVGPMDTEDVAVIATQPKNHQEPLPSTRPETPAPTEKKAFRTTAPVSGEQIVGYSMETLSYNQTTRDWRVHNGIDLAAEAGAEVAAAADGEVYEVREDELLGHTVVIRHDSGYTTCYSCLAENVTVRKGDRVTVGQTIGYAGDTAIVESALGSHIHFSVSRYDVPVDPAAFLALGQ